MNKIKEYLFSAKKFLSQKIMLILFGKTAVQTEKQSLLKKRCNGESLVRCMFNQEILDMGSFGSISTDKSEESSLCDYRQLLSPSIVENKGYQEYLLFADL